MRKASAYSTDLVHEESAHDLCAKCEKSALEWYPVATQLWNDPDDPRAKQRLEPDVGMSESDMEKFKKLGRDPRKERSPQGARCDRLDAFKLLVCKPRACSEAPERKQ